MRPRLGGPRRCFDTAGAPMSRTARQVSSILVVAPMPPPVHGMSEASRIVVEGLRRRGLDVNVVDINDASVHRVSRLVLVVSAICRVFLCGIRERPDVGYLAMAQSRLGMLRDIAFVVVFRFLRIPVVGHVHGGRMRVTCTRLWWPLRAAYQATMRELQCLIALDETFAQEHRTVLPTVPHRAIANPVDTQLLQLLAGGRRALWSGDGPFRVLFMGTLYKTKGLYDLLQATRTLLEAGWDVRLDLAGAPPKGDKDVLKVLEQLRREWPSVVIYHGVARGDAKVRLLLESHVFVLPTYYLNEGQPIALLEAMAAGLPSIVTAHRGIPRVLKDGQEGIVVPPMSPEAIAEALLRIYTSPSIWREMSVAAARRSYGFNVDAYLSGLLSVLGVDYGAC